MEAIVNNLIKATGWSIFHSLWQAAIIYGLLLLLIAVLPRVSAKLKHNLAYGAICIMFTSFVVTFFYIFKWPTSGKSIASPDLGHQLINNPYLSGFSDTIGNRTEQFFPYLVTAYTIGLLFQLTILTAGYRKLHLLKQSHKLAVPITWQTTFEELLSKLNLRQQIKFYLSEHVNVPLVVGYFKPVVLFPIALVAQLDIKQVEAILIHELSHIRRNDYLLNLIKTAIETLLFFNPFVWLSGRLINIEREHACDDLVLQLTGTPLTYAHALLKLEILKDKSTPALSMAASGKQQHLYQRIKRITDMKTNYRNAKQQLFATTLALVTMLSLVWVKPSKAENSNQKIFQQERVEITSTNIKKAPCPPTAPKPITEPKAPTVNAPEPPDAPDFLPSAIPAPPVPPCPINKVLQDTTKKKIKKTVIVIDGKKSHINNNIDIVIDTIINNSIAFLKSPEWKKSISDIRANAENMGQYFNSTEWKQQQMEIRQSAEEVKKYFHSKEWRKQQEEIRKAAEEIRISAEEIRKQAEAKRP